MRIVHLANHTGRNNGNVHAAVDLACAEADLGQEVMVCSSGGDFDDLLRSRQIEVVTMPDLARPTCALKSVLALRRLIERHDLDIVHAHMVKTAVLGFAATRGSRCRLVTTVHNAFQKSAMVMGLGDRVIPVSQAVGAAMSHRGLSRRRLRQVLNGTVGSARFAGAPVEPLAMERPAVLFVGGLHERKGLPELLRGFSMARRSRPDLHLHLVGWGPKEAMYKAAVSDGDRSHVHFHGQVSDPRPYMLGADLLVLPSRADPAPLVISEAREAGLAIIAARVDGVPELLDHGRAGLLIEPRRPKAISAAILEVVRDEESLKAYRSISRDNLEHLSVDRVARQTLAVYEEISCPRKTGPAEPFSGRPLQARHGAPGQ